MIYNSLNFLLIFPIIFGLYYCIPSKYVRVRNLFLLLASYLLYLQWKPAYVVVLLGVTLITYSFGRIFEFEIQSSDNGWRTTDRRNSLLWAGVLLALLPLLVFKYYNFLNSNIGACLNEIGLHFSLPGLNWTIPVGISFFTFQALGYIIDVYHKRIAAEHNFLDYALFVSFFPSIMSGPINKASLVLPQLKAQRPYFDYSKSVEGLKYLLWGMLMKVVIADRVGLYVDTVYDNFVDYSGMTLLVASVLYSIQIYSDFAGYSLMAIGTGKLLGFELTENFRRPYFAISVTDFWHRWHISLSTWLKDYIYIPLGGSRCSKARNYWNIFVTFLVSGIWHGANWTYIVWGMIHGITQIVEKFTGFRNVNKTKPSNVLFHILITFFVVDIAWIFFRMPSLLDAVDVIKRIFTMRGGIEVYFPGFTNGFFIAFGCVLLCAKDVRDEFFPSKFPFMMSRHLAVRWATYLLILATILLCGVFDAGQFIYANF